jgi:curved DNA-binding protein CbpA
VKNYYKILEVDENATRVEIKKSYRSLAKKYHPDKSSSPSAAQLFNEVNEAYEILSDSDQKVTYDQRRSDATSYRTSQPQRAYSSRRPPRSRPDYRSSSQQIDVTPYVPYFRKISYLGLVLSIVLSIDFVLPRSVQQESVTDINRIMSKSRTGQVYLYAIQVTTDNGEFRLGPYEDNPFSVGKKVSIHRSRIFNLTTSISSQEIAPSKEYLIKASIFANFSFSLIVLLITSVVGSLLKKPPMNILNFGIVNGVLLLLTIYFLSVS